MSCVTSAFIVWLTYLLLAYTAKPRVVIDFLGEASTGSRAFSPKETVLLRFRARNVGHFYARPAATNNELYLNFPESFDLLQVRHGSRLELSNRRVGRGKLNSKFFTVKGIHLYHGEGPEEVLVKVRAPAAKGDYSGWVATRSEQTDHGISVFHMSVV